MICNLVAAAFDGTLQLAIRSVASGPSVKLLLEVFGIDVDAKDLVAKIKFYNYHLFSLACLLALEGGTDAEVKASIGRAHLAMLSGPAMLSGKDNALFALLAVKSGACSKDDPRVREALAPLLAGSRGGVTCFQHDLLLASMPLIAELAAADPARAALIETIGQRLGKPAWIDEFAKWDLPWDFNPKEQWGRCRIYSNAAHARTFWQFPADPFGLRIVEEIFKNRIGGEYLLDHPAITAEAGEVEFLLTRLLAAEAELCPAPTVEPDQQIPLLPYAGMPGGL